MTRGLELYELVLRIPRPPENPAHRVHRVPVVVAGRRHQRHPVGFLQVGPCGGGQAAAQEYCGLDLRMAARQQHRLIDAATRPRDADAILVDTGLRQEPGERCVDVAGPLFGNHRLLRLEVVETLPFALAKAPVVKSHHVIAARGGRLREPRPGAAIAVALVQEHEPGTRLARGVIAALQRCAVRRLQGHGRHGWLGQRGGRTQGCRREHRAGSQGCHGAIIIGDRPAVSRRMGQGARAWDQWSLQIRDRQLRPRNYYRRGSAVMLAASESRA